MRAGRAQRSAEWKSRKVLAWTLRAATVVVPLLVAIAAMTAVAHVIHRPRALVSLVLWYALLLAVSWVVARLVSKVVDRTLPLAALLEMTLTFPESAPSRLGVVQRDSSATMLARLAVAPPDETAQAAAERILKLLTALSQHDRWTRGHAERVRAYADLIAERMDLPAVERERLTWAALLHDIGKLQIPAALLNKAAKPTAGEWDVLKQHPTIGSVIAAPLLGWLAPMERVIAEHHERWDGTGYPLGLAGEAISRGARIVCVADSFEAMTAVRPYSKPRRKDAALRELVDCAGTHFDPTVVRALLAVPRRRLAWAMGPAAWLGGLPALGQGSIATARTAATHGVSAAVGTGAVVVAAVAPVSLLGAPVAADAALSSPVTSTSAAVAGTGTPHPKPRPHPTGTRPGDSATRPAGGTPDQSPTTPGPARTTHTTLPQPTSTHPVPTTPGPRGPEGAAVAGHLPGGADVSSPGRPDSGAAAAGRLRGTGSAHPGAEADEGTRTRADAEAAEACADAEGQAEQGTEAAQGAQASQGAEADEGADTVGRPDAYAAAGRTDPETEAHEGQADKGRSPARPRHDPSGAGAVRPDVVAGWAAGAQCAGQAAQAAQARQARQGRLTHRGDQVRGGPEAPGAGRTTMRRCAGFFRIRKSARTPGHRLLGRSVGVRDSSASGSRPAHPATVCSGEASVCGIRSASGSRPAHPAGSRPGRAVPCGIRSASGTRPAHLARAATPPPMREALRAELAGRWTVTCSRSHPVRQGVADARRGPRPWQRYQPPWAFSQVGRLPVSTRPRARRAACDCPHHLLEEGGAAPDVGP